LLTIRKTRNQHLPKDINLRKMAISSYAIAVRYNNEGVFRLEAGDYRAARSFFKRALDTMTDAITHDADDQDMDGEDLTLGFQWSVNPKKRALHEADQVGCSFVYSRALYISASKNIQKAEYTEESAAIVYNLALSFHLMGTENNSESMEKAIQFYEIASAIRSRKSQTKLEILDLAILNNIGQICVECFNFNAARQCFNQLSNRLVFLNHSGILTDFLEQNDCDGFVLNVMLEEPSLAAAA
jgi:tetratricopeptide (TPR) repeat protein